MSGVCQRLFIYLNCASHKYCTFFSVLVVAFRPWANTAFRCIMMRSAQTGEKGADMSCETILTVLFKVRDVLLDRIRCSP